MRVQIGNTAFDNVTMPETVDWIMEAVRRNDRPRLVCTGNLDHLVTLHHDAQFRAIYADADLVLADGMPIVWLSRLMRQPLKERVAGSDLFWELGRASAEHGLRLFFLGGRDGAADAAAEAVRQRYPGARICGIYCPPFAEFGTPAEEARIAAAIRRATPDVLLVAFGAPKQEKWIQTHREHLGVPVSIGVGGSFEMAAGMIQRAPRWMQVSGLEWFHRMVKEPRRMVHRYLGRDLPFLLHLVRDALQARRRTAAR